jgi:hypothetical protein
MSANSSKGGGPREVSDPFFKTISPQAGQSFIANAQRYCIRHFSEVVSIFCSGIMPIEMLEFPMPVNRINVLARKAGCYTTPSGQIAREDQTAADWREQLIAETRDQHDNCSDGEALKLLFPSYGKKNRDTKRQQIASQSLNLIQNLNLFWPSEAVILEMNRDIALRKATETVDLIAWTNAFTSFCLNNSGNAELNAKAAEDALEDVIMKGQDLAAYTKAFKTAATNVKLCKSTMTESEIVGTFFRNLNQSSDAFDRYHIRHLDNSDPLFPFMSKPLEDAISHVEIYHKTVILTALARRKSTSISSIAALKHHMEAGSSGALSVSKPVLAAMLKNNGDTGVANGSSRIFLTNNNNKRKVEVEKDSDRKKAKNNNNNNKKTEMDATVKSEEVKSGTSVAESSETKKKFEKRVCYSFQKGEKCRFGENCHFRHSA